MKEQSVTGLLEIDALLGPGTEFEGKLIFRGRARIDGQLRGDVSTDDLLIIGEDGHVIGDVAVGTLIVLGGTIEGTVKATKLVELHAPTRINGDIETPQLYLDRGVTFQGKCSMNSDATIVPLVSEAEPTGT